MNRRDAIKSAMGAIGVAATGAKLTAQPESGEALFAVLTFPAPLNPQQRAAFRKEWAAIHSGQLIDVPLVILQHGTTIKVYRRDDIQGVEVVESNDTFRRQLEECKKQIDELKLLVRRIEPQLQWAT